MKIGRRKIISFPRSGDQVNYNNSTHRNPLAKAKTTFMSIRQRTGYWFLVLYAYEEQRRGYVWTSL